jgi:hypothetical protein
MLPPLICAIATDAKPTDQELPFSLEETIEPPKDDGSELVRQMRESSRTTTPMSNMNCV